MDPYFSTPVGDPTQAGRFVDVAELPTFELAAGLSVQPLLGNGAMVSFVRYEPGAEAPLHAHVEEQIFIVIEGEFEVELGEEVRKVSSGQVALIPSWVPHRVTAGPEPAFQLDIFCPPRQGLLDMLAAAQA